LCHANHNILIYLVKYYGQVYQMLWKDLIINFTRVLINHFEDGHGFRIYYESQTIISQYITLCKKLITRIYTIISKILKNSAVQNWYGTVLGDGDLSPFSKCFQKQGKFLQYYANLILGLQERIHWLFVITHLLWNVWTVS